MNVVEDTLTCYHSEGTPLHIIEAMMVAAADENIHLDCSYSLWRREPDVLVRLLSGPHSNNNNDDGDDGGSDGGGTIMTVTMRKTMIMIMMMVMVISGIVKTAE